MTGPHGPEHPRVGAVVFDLDGVLIDSEPAMRCELGQLEFVWG